MAKKAMPTVCGFDNCKSLVTRSSLPPGVGAYCAQHEMIMRERIAREQRYLVLVERACQTLRDLEEAARVYMQGPGSPSGVRENLVMAARKHTRALDALQDHRLGD